MNEDKISPGDHGGFAPPELCIHHGKLSLYLYTPILALAPESQSDPQEWMDSESISEPRR